MRRALKFAVLALSLFSSSALPQQPPNSGSIEGIVLRSDTSRPISNAEVTLIPGSAGLPGFGVTIRGQIGPISTGTDGGFLLQDIQPGAYRLFATAAGLVRQAYGQQGPYGSGRLLYVSNGERITNIKLNMAPAGVVNGHVYDESGKPAAGVRVELMRLTFNDRGGRGYDSVLVSTDDRGAFRFFSVAPGRCYLFAGNPPGGNQIRSVSEGASTAGLSPTFSLVFYPDAMDFEHAASIEVKAGEDASYDMHVKRQLARFRVRGHVIGGTGEGISAGFSILLGWRSWNSWGTATAVRAIDPVTGAFELQNVPPGDYFILAQSSVAAPLPGQRGALTALARQAEVAFQPSASVPIRVLDSDVEGLVLRLTRGMVVNGRVTVEGDTKPALPTPDRLRINLSGTLPIPGSFPVATIMAADGTFQVNGVREGEFPIQISVPDFYVKSIKYGEDEILGKLLKFNGSTSKKIEVTLRVGTATVTGSVTDSKSQPASGIDVVLIPADRSRVDLFRTSTTDREGHYSLQSLAPGEYKAFSWESIENYAYMDPDVLKQYEHLGKAISVVESSNSNLDLKLIPAQ